MAQFIAFEEGVEVNGQTILSHIKTLPHDQETRSEILHAHGIDKPEAGRWYPQQGWLNALKNLMKRSEGTSFLCWPSHPGTRPVSSSTHRHFRKSPKIINQAYQKHHRGGEIGSYRLVTYNEQKRKAVMICQTPYPGDFDRGIISKLVEKFRPCSSGRYAVELDTEKTSRTKGNHSGTYNIY